MSELPLIFIPGPILSRASKGLPDPSGHPEKFCEAVVTVRIRYERMSSVHGKSARRYFWTADSATIEIPGCDDVRPL